MQDLRDFLNAKGTKFDQSFLIIEKLFYGIYFSLQISTFKNLGLDTPRSFVYGAICSFLAPSGYGRSREPDSQPFGLSLMPNLIAGGNNQGRNATATFNGRYAGHHEVGRYLEIYLNINDTHKLLLV